MTKTFIIQTIKEKIDVVGIEVNSLDPRRWIKIQDISGNSHSFNKNHIVSLTEVEETEMDAEALLIKYEHNADRQAFRKLADLISELPRVNPRTEMGENLLDVINLKLDELETFLCNSINEF